MHDQQGHSPTAYVPVIDLALAGEPCSAGVVATIDSAFRTSGFVVVVGHGFPAATMAALYDAGQRFFRQDEAARSAVVADPLDPLQRGYTPGDRLLMYSANSYGLPQAQGMPLYAPNKWPDVPGFRDAYLDYYGHAQALAARLMRCCALALGVGQHWFDDKFDRHMTPLTVNYYPPPSEVSDSARIRNEPHTDFTALTILYADDSPGGLEVHAPGGDWVAVPPIPGSFVVNIGRLLSTWTNDVWESTLHRVVNPPPQHSDRDRSSIAFFYQPNFDALIECVPTCATAGRPARYPPVVAGDQFVARARRAYVRSRMRDRAAADAAD